MSALIKETPESSFAPSLHVRTEKRCHLWTRKWALSRHRICFHLDLGLPTLHNGEKSISVAYKPPVCGILLQLPKRAKPNKKVYVSSSRKAPLLCTNKLDEFYFIPYNEALSVYWETWSAMSKSGIRKRKEKNTFIKRMNDNNLYSDGNKKFYIRKLWFNCCLDIYI